MKNILITGAATGIGLAIAEALSKSGYAVFATVMPRQECAELRQLDHINVVEADLSMESDILTLIDSIRAIERLDGIISCAGFAVPGPMELVPAEQLTLQFQVNTFAPFQIIQGLLPLLRISKGRIILIGAGQARVPLPCGGPYGASKAALCALADSLRAEISAQDVQISVIEPGAIKTGILKSSEERWIQIFEHSSKNIPESILQNYKESMEKSFIASRKAFENAISPNDFASFVLSVLNKANPKPLYLFGREARILGFIARLPASIRAKITAKMA